VVSFKTLTLYPHYPFDRKLGGPQSRPRRGGEEKKSPTLHGMETGRPARELVTILTELSRLPYTGPLRLRKWGS